MYHKLIDLQEGVPVYNRFRFLNEVSFGSVSEVQCHYMGCPPAEGERPTYYVSTALRDIYEAFYDRQDFCESNLFMFQDESNLPDGIFERPFAVKVVGIASDKMFFEDRNDIILYGFAKGKVLLTPYFDFSKTKEYKSFRLRDLLY
jgi:hypothetical protein